VSISVQAGAYAEGLAQGRTEHFTVKHEIVEQVAEALYYLMCRKRAANPRTHEGPVDSFETLRKYRPKAYASYIEQARVALLAAGIQIEEEGK
jgi:hypothetical protein